MTWPSRKETLVTTGLVFAMAAVTSMFFFVVDQVDRPERARDVRRGI